MSSDTRFLILGGRESDLPPAAKNGWIGILVRRPCPGAHFGNPEASDTSSGVRNRSFGTSRCPQIPGLLFYSSYKGIYRLQPKTAESDSFCLLCRLFLIRLQNRTHISLIFFEYFWRGPEFSKAFVFRNHRFHTRIPLVNRYIPAQFLEMSEEMNLK